MKISAATYFVSLAFFASTSLALNESQRLTRIFQNIKAAQTKALQNNPADRTVRPSSAIITILLMLET